MGPNMSPDDGQQLSARIAARLADHPGFAPLGYTAAEVQLFSDHDLASLVEARCGHVIDPNSLDDSAREAWLQHTAVHGEVNTPKDNGPKYYWLRDGAKRVGTIAYWVLPHGRGSVYISSLYVLPDHRRHGWARRGLTALRDAAFAEGAREARWDVSWCSQHAVHFYCALGMWVQSWKRDLVFMSRPGLPCWRVNVEGDVAHFVVGHDRRVLIVAERLGDRLGWSELPEPSGPDHDLLWHARGTFAVALAMRGWPLLRSDALWDQQLRQGFSDGGGPEGLAFKIRHLEAWARKNEWVVDTPRVPGLDYPAWDA